jgi:hypothetical protein
VPNPWDKYPAAEAAPWAKYPAAEQAPAPALAGMAAAAPAGPQRELHDTSRGEALLRGALSYGSREFGDEIAAGIGAGLYGAARTVRGLLPGGVPEGAPGVGDVYGQILEQQRTANDSARASHPLAYHGAGIATSALQTPGIAGVGQLSNAARITALASSGALQGGLTGAGAAEGGIGDRFGRGAQGAVLGALLAPAGDAAVRGLGAVAGTAASGLQKAAGFALSRVAGGIQRDVGPAGGAAKFAAAGLEGKARGLIRPWDFLPGAAERQAGRVAEFARQSTDDIVSAIDDSGARVAVAPLKQSLLGASAKLRQFEDANPAALAKVDGIIRSLEKQADSAGTVSARTLQTAKEVIDDFVKTWDPFGKSNLAQDLNKAMYRGVMEAQEQAVEAGGGVAGRAAYEAAKGQSSLARRLESFQASAEARQANQLAGVGGLHGALGGIAGLAHTFATGDPVRGLATFGLTRFATSPRTHALAALAASRAAQSLPDYASSALNPLIARSAAQAIVASLNQE